MQYQKDEMKNNIIEKALDEFSRKGFEGASMRRIAKSSGSSVGNIYKYFRSKEELFETIIGPVYSEVMDYISRFDRVELNYKADSIFFELSEKLMEIFTKSSAELSILLNKSAGSRYENCKTAFIDFITKIITDVMEYKLSVQGKKLKDNYVIYLVSHSLVESICIILNEKKDGSEVKRLIINLIDIFYTGMADKLDSTDYSK